MADDAGGSQDAQLRLKPTWIQHSLGSLRSFAVLRRFAFGYAPPAALDDKRILPRVITEERSDLAAGVIRSLLWLAAFCFAAGLFLAATLLLRGIPPTPHVAVGRVTVENASKLRDYLTVLLFFIVAPATTIPLYRLGARANASFRAAVAGDGMRNIVSTLFVTPFLLAPFLYLTTFKPAWPILIPLALSQLLPRAVIGWQRSLWIRRLFAKEMVPHHALIVVEAMAWILFRYI